MLDATKWIALILGLVAPASEVGESQGEILLEWEAPEECPDAVDVRQRIGALLKDERPPATTVHVRGRIIIGENARWRMELLLRTEGGTSTRTVEDERCEALADAAALVVAVAVDPQLETPPPLESGDPPPTDPTLEVVPAPQPEPAEPPAPDPPPTSNAETSPPRPVTRTDRVQGPRRKPRPWPRFGFRAGGLVDSTPLPRAAWGVGGAAALFGRFWRAELGGAYWFGREATIAGTMASGTVALWALRAGGYGVPFAGPVEFPLGVALEAGALEGSGSGATLDPQNERQPWIALLVDAQVIWSPWRRFALGAAVTGVVPFIHAGFVIGEELLHRVDPIGIRGHAFLEVRTP